MPKAPAKNGYYYFMTDFRSREERQGRRFRGMNEVAEAASEEWKNLTQQERDDYNAYAKDMKYSEDRPNVAKKPKPLEKKYNSEGKNLAVIKREHDERKRYEEEIRKFVERFIQNKTVEELKTDVFHLAHVNYFCKTEDEEQTYYPAEMAIAKFSLEEGLIDTYHTFFSPEEIKKGYMYAVKERSERYHKITLEYVRAEKDYGNYEKIYDNICKFLQLGKKRSSVPLFTMIDDAFHNTSYIAVEKTLEGLWHSKHSASTNDWKKYFPVYPLHYLMYQLKNAGYRYQKGEPISKEESDEDQRALPNASLAAIELNKDTYNMKDEFACHFHVENDAVAHCSLSFVSRWAQLIRDHCCLFFGIEFSDVVGLNASEYDFCSARSFGAHPPSYTPSLAPSRLTTSFKEEDDDFTDCQSVASGYSTRTDVTHMTEASVGFLPNKESKPAAQSSKSSVVSGKSTGSVWHGGRGRARAAASAAPLVDEDNFPSLGGVRRCVRGMKLD